MTKPASTRYLAAFREIERTLRARTDLPKPVGFSQMVSSLAGRDSVVRRFKVDLLEYADLRNAIVHDGMGGCAIAEPHEETVERLEQIKDALEDPPRVIPRFQRDVIRASPGDAVGTVLRRMVSQDLSQVPVYEEDTYKALLSLETVARWAGSMLKEEDGLLVDAPVREVLTFREYREEEAFIGRNATAFEALAAFERSSKEGRPLRAMLITHRGRRTEKPLGILSVSDIPALLDAVSGAGE